MLVNANGFGVDIPGSADASKNIREIAIDELNIDVREMTMPPAVSAGGTERLMAVLSASC